MVAEVRHFSGDFSRVDILVGVGEKDSEGA